MVDKVPVGERKNASRKPDLWMPFFVSDYLTDTRHLSRAEHGSYMLMLAHAWMHEGVLPDDEQRLARIAQCSQREWQKSRHIIMEFWTKTDEGYTQKRLMIELARAKVNVQQKSKAGKASAAKRWGHSDEPESVTAVITADTTAVVTAHVTARQRLDAPLPLPKEQGQKRMSSAAPIPDCPQSAILEIYGELLPMLRQPREWTGSRAAQLQARWKHYAKANGVSPGYTTQEEGIDFWRTYFGYVAKCKTLTEGIPRRPPQEGIWLPDLQWLVNAENFRKVIDGKYATT